MSFKLGPKSLENLKGVHPDLQRIVERAIGISESDFTVLEGLRSLERQKTLLAAGKSKTLHSRHITGHAVDIIPFPVSWDWKDYPPIEKAMVACASELDENKLRNNHILLHHVRMKDFEDALFGGKELVE